MSNQIVVGPVRFSYLSLLEKSENLNGDMQYSAVIMVPKEDKKLLAKIQAGMQAAIDLGIKKGKIKKADVRNLRLPLRDGDDKDDRGSKGSEFDGVVWFNANNKINQPSVVDLERQPIMDDEEIYSGMWGYAHITFSVYNAKGSKGIGAYINYVMKTKDDERLDGRISVEDAFEEIEPLEGDLE